MIHDIISLVYDMTATGSVSSYPLVQWYHTICIYDITPTMCIISYTLYKASHPHFMTSHHIMHDITCTVFMTSLPLYLTLHPLYRCLQTQCISYTTPTLCMTSHTLCMTSQSVCMTSHEHFMTSYLYRYDITSIYLWHHIQYIWYHPCCFHENTATMLDISPTIFDIRVSVSVLSQPIYWCHDNNYGSHHTWHTYDIINTPHLITFTLCDINPQSLWHHKHCIHDIRSPIYYTPSKVYDISSPIPVISQPLYL